MKTTLLLLLGICISTISRAQIVNIPDANFKAALLAHSPTIDTNSDGEIQVSEAAAFTGTLNVGAKNIADLKGIEAFNSLKILYIYDNQLTALDLSSNTELTQLACYKNQLTSLDLTANLVLENLNCWNNKITTLNISSNVSLTSLDCSTNSLSVLNISPITALTYITCSNNKLTNLDVTNNTLATSLRCDNNQLTTLDVRNNTELISLSCDNNKITTLDLLNNPKLTSLGCRDNLLTFIDLSNNIALTDLACSSNSLSELNISHLQSLIYLNCHQNLLTSLDVSNNLELQKLFSRSNQLTVLDLSSNLFLTNIDCDVNQLTLLKLPITPTLLTLSCSSNKLSTLDVSGNRALKTLHCYINKLTYLDLTSNTALSNFQCHINQLTWIDLRSGSNTKLTTVNMALNPTLTCVSVDDPAFSATKWLNKDPATSFSSDCACGVFSVDKSDITDIICDKPGKIRIDISGADAPFVYEWIGLTAQTDSVLSTDSSAIYTLKVTNNSGCESVLRYIIKAPKSKDAFELNTNLSIATSFRPGRVTCVNLSAWNDGCKERSGLLTLRYHGPVTFESASLPPSSHQTNKNTLKWNFSQMKYADIALLTNVCFRVDTLAQTTDRICFDVEITPRADDLDSTNNDKSYCYTVRNSYDPNDKQVYPQGVCAENFTLKDKPLTYTIRFQNTGNAPAIDIHLLDSLSPYLDITTLRVLTASHSGLVTEVLRNKVLKFDFKNINLADSLSNEEASKGFVVFEISPHAGLVDGTVIENSVGIYFDFNPPVLTNKTRNTLVASIPEPQKSTILDTLYPTYSYRGFVYREAGEYQHHFYSQSGCDSVVYLNLAMGTVSKGTDTQTACGSYTWIDGNTYTNSNSTAKHTLSGAAFNGNDSIVSLNLTINTSTSGTAVISKCVAYTWIDGNTYTASNNNATHTLTGAAANGCDSIVTLNLTFNSSAIGTDVISTCEAYTWIDGNSYSASNNTATHTLIGAAANGCDSIVTLNLTFNSSAIGTDVISTCGSYTWIDGNSYSASNNTATHTLIGAAANGCDSIVTLNLTFNSSAIGTDVISTCGPYTWIDGNSYTASNNNATHTLTGAAANGCDSIVTLNLTFNSSAIGTDVISTCEAYTWIDGNSYSASNNTATHTLIGAAANGCDSIVTLNLTFNSSAIGTDVITTCEPYTWIDGNSYSASNNNATHTLIGAAANGCDSIVTLNFTFNPSLNVSLASDSNTLTVGEANATYQWIECSNGVTNILGATEQSFVVTEDGSYAVIVTSSFCSDTSSCENIKLGGLTQDLQLVRMVVYPNPSAGKVVVDFGELQTESALVILDLQGRVLQEMPFSNLKSLSFDFEEAAGTYLLQLLQGGRIVATQRLTKL